MELQESRLNSLLAHIGYKWVTSVSKDDVLVIYHSKASHTDNLCDIGKIDRVLEYGDKLGDNALKNLIEEKIEELDRKIISGVSEAMTYSQRTD